LGSAVFDGRGSGAWVRGKGEMHWMSLKGFLWANRPVRLHRQAGPATQREERPREGPGGAFGMW
jgi:hypothetical protein